MCLLAASGIASAFVPPQAFTQVARPEQQALSSSSHVALSGGPVLAGGGACGVFTGGALTRRRQQQQQQCLPRGALGEIATAGRTTALRMAASDTQADKLANVGALGVAAGCSVVASAVSEISPHAAAFVQLVCLSIWLGMSVYATFVWPIITGINMRDSSEFASLLGKLGPSYLQLSAAMIMSLGTSSLVIGHANETQLAILGVALAITLYNAIVLEPTAQVALEEELAAEQRLSGRKLNKSQLKDQEDLPKKQAVLANFLGAEVLLDLLAIVCAGSYAWDLASSISFA